MLKFILTAAVLTAIYSSAYAQTNQGDRFNNFSGSISYRRSTQDLTISGISNTNFGASLNFQRGRFVRDDLAHGWLLGLQVNRGMLKQTGSLGGNRTTSSFSPTLQTGYFVRRYLRVSEPLRFFAQAQVSGIYSPVFTKYQDADINSSSQNVSLRVQPVIGATFFLKNGWALEAQTTLGIASLTHFWANTDEPRTMFSANSGLNFDSFKVGIAKYFGGNPVSSSLFPPAPETIYQPGQRYVGGSFNTNVNFNTPGRNGNVSFTSARFKSTNQARGVSLSLGFGNSRNPGSVYGDVYRANQFSVGVRPFREYYWPLAEKWSVFLNAGLNINYTGVSSKLKFRNPSNSSPSRTTSSYQSTGQVALSAFPGIQYQFAPRWALAATVGSMSAGGLNFDWIRAHSAAGKNDYRRSDFYLGTPTINLSNFGLSLRYFPQKGSTAPDSF